MGKGAGGKLSQIVKPKRRSMRREEQVFQASLVKTLAMVLDPSAVLFAVPNGGGRFPIEAKILVGQGLLPGMPDLMVVWPGPHGGTGAGMEIKAGAGVVDEDQVKVHARLERAGIPVAVIRTLPEALNFLDGLGVPFRIKPASIKGLE